MPVSWKVPSSNSRSIRSRTVRRPEACWRATRSSPPIRRASSSRRRSSSSSGSQLIGGGAYSLRRLGPVAGATSEFERALADAGGADAPRELSARLRGLLSDELDRGERELGEPRSGYDTPVAVAVAAGETALVCALPLPTALRADPGVVSDRGAELAAAAVERIVEAAGPGPPASAEALSLMLGECAGHLALAYPAAEARDAADYAKEALEEAFTHLDRLRARAHVVPGHVLAPLEDPRPPIGPTHPLRVAEAVTRLGGSPLDDETMEALEPRLLELLEPAGSVARAHEDPDPARRVTRRILQ